MLLAWYVTGTLNKRHWRNFHNDRVKCRCRCRGCRPQNLLFGLVRHGFKKMSGKRRNLNLSNIIPMPLTRSFKQKKSQQFNLVVCSFSDDFPATGFPVRIVNVCLFQVVVAHCCSKLTQADICHLIRGFSQSNKTTRRDEHFKFVYTRHLTELAENWQVCFRIPPSKVGVGLCVFSLLFQSYDLLSRKKNPH